MTEGNRQVKTALFFYGAAVMNLEDDIAAFTIMVANDPRTVNKLVIYKPADNIISQSELVSLWEKKTGRTFQRVFLPEVEMVVLSQSKRTKSLRFLL